MGYQERFLKRLQNQEVVQTERDSGESAQEIQSILEHLQRLLNTRQGSVPIRPDYGLPDFSHLSGDTFIDAAQEMRRSLCRVLETFEPRLSRVQVTFDSKSEDRTRLRFRVEGVLARDERVPLTLDTTLSPEGRISLQA